MFYSIQLKKLNQSLKKILLVKKLGSNILTGYANTTFIQLTLEEIQLAK